MKSCMLHLFLQNPKSVSNKVANKVLQIFEGGAFEAPHFDFNTRSTNIKLTRNSPTFWEVRLWAGFIIPLFLIVHKLLIQNQFY